MAAPKDYRKLPGKTFLALRGEQTLWVGRDHLLAVVTGSFIEEYKRYYYKDIQAFITRPLKNHIRTSAGFIAAALFFGWLMFEYRNEGGVLFTGFMAGMSLAGLVFNFFRGPSAAVFVQTAVQTDRLASLSRLRTAGRVIAELKPLILAAQSETPDSSAQEPEAPPP